MAASNREVIQVVVPEALRGLRHTAEQVASAAGMTVSAWAVRVLATALKRSPTPASAKAPRRKPKPEPEPSDW